MKPIPIETSSKPGLDPETGGTVPSGSLATMVPVAASDRLQATTGGIGNFSVRFY